MPKETGDYTLGGDCGKDLFKVPFWLLKLGFVALLGRMRR